MRVEVSPVVGKSIIRLCAAVLLASVVTGCGSDSTRFGNVFDGADQVTTSSVPRSPAPSSAPVASAGPYAASPVNSAPVSEVRAVSTPMSVQRVALADPASANGNPQSPSRNTYETSAVPEPGRRPSTPGGSKSVTLGAGETVNSLSRKYGVPESEILKANGLKSGSQAQSGQRLVIPALSVSASAAKASASDTASSLDINGKLPSDDRTRDRDVAILPGSPQTRDKSDSKTGTSTGNLGDNGAGAANGNYTVKQGDSLNKIAQAHGVPVADLKKANGITTGSIRIGQTLALPTGAAKAADPVQTASVQPPKAQTTKPTDPTPAAAAAPTAPKESVNEVASRSDVTDDSPKSTGINKYRWPVRGAVIAGYGANVDGNRNDGIDISVPEGTPIKAAENGVVIYSGSSLKELGNAVLVRHDDGTVTVYGHANTLNVTRGQKVQRGQTLAESGMSGNAKRPTVHFEVRKNATPVNPATFLE